MKASTILKVIESRDPGLITTITTELQPLRTDYSQIKAIYQVYLLRSIFPNEDTMRRLEFVAIIARLYNPSALYIDLTKVRGLSKEIANCLDKCSIRTVSYYMAQARHYYRHVASFKERVDKLSLEL